jgi:hypothetical protein
VNIWPAKDSNETVAYVADWTDQLGTDQIASYTTVITGAATIARESLAIKQISYLIAGGTSGASNSFLIRITTKAGQILERTYTLLVLDDASSFRPTTTTKRTLVDAMFNEVALNGWELDITPEEKDTALTRLDGLMWELSGRGMDLGYNFPDGIGQGNLADELGCPDQAFNGLAIMGAHKLCPTMGKKLSQESREALSHAMKAVRSASNGFVPSVSLPKGTPLGSGNKPWSTRYPFQL